MLHRIETTDPITGRDVKNLAGKPYVLESGTEEDLTIYFESEASRQQYLAIPVEHPVEHRTILNNTTDEGYDEG